MRLTWLALLVSTRVLAQASLSDSFTNGRVSPWDLTQNPRGVPFTEGLVDAGKVGDGFRIIDNDSTTGSNTTMCLIKGISGAGNQFARVWFHNTPTTTVGTAHPLMIHQNFGSQTVAEVIWDQAAQEFDLQCFDHARNYVKTLGVEDGGWHLLEIGVVGEGTIDAGCVGAIDGVVGVSFAPLDLDGGQFTQLLVGEPWGELDFQGTLDLDEYRADPLPMPSQLVVTAPQPIRPLTCWAATVSIEGTFGSTVAPTLSNTPVQMHFTAGNTYANPTCTFMSSTAVIPAGSTTTFFWVKANGAYDFWATTPDLVSVHLTGVTGVADAGTPDAGTPDAGEDAGAPDAGTVDGGELEPDGGVTDAGGGTDAGANDAGARDAGPPDGGPDNFTERSLGVGCGCSGGPDVALSLGLLAFLRYTRRRCRRNTARPSSSSSGSR